MNRATKCLCAALVGAVSATASAQLGFTVQDTPLLIGASGLAYGPDGTLFVVSGGGSSSVLSIAPDGTQTSIDLDASVSIDSPVGAAFDAVNNRLLVTDNESFLDGEGNLLGIDLETGLVETLASGFDTIDDVAVRSTGEVFFSDAAGSGAGGVYKLEGGAPQLVTGGLDLAAGLGFDLDGNLLVQDVSSTNFAGSVSLVTLSESSDGLVASAPELVADGVAGFDLAVDSEGDVFVTGSGGLFELDRDASGDFLGTASTLIAEGFSTEVAFIAGTVAFEPFLELPGGEVSPLLTFVPSFGASELVTLSVPEPSVAALLGLGLLSFSARGRREVRK